MMPAFIYLAQLTVGGGKISQRPMIVGVPGLSLLQRIWLMEFEGPLFRLDFDALSFLG